MILTPVLDEPSHATDIILPNISLADNKWYFTTQFKDKISPVKWSVLPWWRPQAAMSVLKNKGWTLLKSSFSVQTPHPAPRLAWRKWRTAKTDQMFENFQSNQLDVKTSGFAASWKNDPSKRQTTMKLTSNLQLAMQTLHTKLHKPTQTRSCGLCQGRHTATRTTWC